jgi:hypothetical protein
MRFAEPAPRERPLVYEKFRWPIACSEPLPVDSSVASPQVVEPLRRTRREFNAVPLTSLGALLWNTARCQETLSSDLGFELQFRPVPSAGAIHPIHILLEHPHSKAWTRYESRTHHLEHLANLPSLASLREKVSALVDPGAGRLFAFIAEPGMTAAKYENSASLIWRDAGILQGAIALTAGRLGLNTCLLGLTGSEYVAALGYEGQLCGVGLAVIGTA